MWGVPVVEKITYTDSVKESISLSDVVSCVICAHQINNTRKETLKDLATILLPH